MKSPILFLLCITFFLSACSPANTERHPSGELLESFTEQNQVVEEVNNIYIPAQPLTMEETIQQFFEQQCQRDIFARYQQLAILKANLMVENPLVFSFAAIAITTDIQDMNEQLDRRKKDFLDHSRKIFEELDLNKFREEVDVKRAIKIISWTVEGFERELLPNAKELLETRDNFKEFFYDLDAYLETIKHCFYK